MTRAGRVHVPAGDREMRAFLALPEGGGTHPGVIVIHEALGLNRDIKDKCRRLAGMGYVALAPDLYDGRGPMPICIYRAFKSLNAGKGPAFEDLDAARGYLAARAEVNPSRVGVIGFCMGGGFALLYAARGPVGAAAVFYGAVPEKAEDLEGACPVVAGYGGRDRLFGKHAERLDRQLTDLNVPHDVRVYPDAGHSFMSDHKGVIATASAWGSDEGRVQPGRRRGLVAPVEAFFAEHLGAEP
jgi:carboxymethylenebutenolidase